jgi:hypothetical protein
MAIRADDRQAGHIGLGEKARQDDPYEQADPSERHAQAALQTGPHRQRDGSDRQEEQGQIPYGLARHAHGARGYDGYAGDADGASGRDQHAPLDGELPESLRFRLQISLQKLQHCYPARVRPAGRVS